MKGEAMSRRFVPPAVVQEQRRKEAEQRRIAKADEPYRQVAKAIKIGVWGFNPDPTWDEFHLDKFGSGRNPDWSFTNWILERVAQWQPTPSPESAGFLS
jgi:hypothetical protein